MTLDKSAGIDLYEISPHSSDNSHTELYETMFSEYALGTARFAASKNNGGVFCIPSVWRNAEKQFVPIYDTMAQKKKETTCWHQAVSNLGDHKWHIKYIEIISLYALIF